jgi:DNA replication and repair protein RecF
MSCEFFKKFSNNTADLRLEYIDTVKYRSLETLKDDFYDLLTINRQRDIQRSFTTAGPHRDDVRFLINGYDARAFGSQGQQRLIVLCLKFAERQVFFMERGEYPIMLLDDVMSELDFFRRRQLLEPDGCQVFVTATDLNILPGEILEKSAIYRVESGQIEVK